MQIILVQSEVEQAIRAYVASQLTLAEGTDIQIDLSATRGADGIKATIDIVPAGTPRPVAVAAPAPAVVVKAAAPAQTAQTPLASAQATLAAATAQKTQDAPAEQAAEVKPETGGQEESSTAAVAGEAGEQTQDAATPVARSLFQGLSRPKNN